MTKRWLAILLAPVVAFAVAFVAFPLATDALAQITIGPGGITLGPGGVQPQQDQRYGQGSIYVNSATYGRNCGARHGNVTSQLGRDCGGRNHCVYYVNANQIGDPAFGCAKDFHVSYTCRQGQQERWASLQPEASGQQIVLDCRY